MHKITTGSTGATRPSLRDWFTAYTCSPRRAGRSSHRPPGLSACRPQGRHRGDLGVDPSVGGSGPHDFAVRFGCARQSQPRRPSPPASTSV